MASLEQRNKSYRIVFMYQGKKHGYSLRTNDRSVAESLLGGVEKTLMRLDNNLLTKPDDIDIVTFRQERRCKSATQTTEKHRQTDFAGAIGPRV